MYYIEITNLFHSMSIWNLMIGRDGRGAGEEIRMKGTMTATR